MQYFVAYKKWCEYHKEFEFVYWSDKKQRFAHKVFGTIFESFPKAQQTASSMFMNAKYHDIDADKFFVLDIDENIIYEAMGE